MAPTENLLSIASWAKRIPAIGALKPADIAAATPHAIKMSRSSSIRLNRTIISETVAPKCTSGPYWPTEAPPLALISAARVDPIPRRTSSRSFVC